MLKRYLSRFPHPVRGLIYALRHDVSYRNQVYLIGALVVGAFTLFEPLEPWEILFILLSYTLILITELQNSAFELALDHLHPARHDSVGKSKDMAAGAVLLAGFFLVTVLCVIAFTRLMG